MMAVAAGQPVASMSVAVRWSSLAAAGQQPMPSLPAALKVRCLSSLSSPMCCCASPFSLLSTAKTSLASNGRAVGHPGAAQHMLEGTLSNACKFTMHIEGGNTLLAGLHYTKYVA